MKCYEKVRGGKRNKQLNFGGKVVHDKHLSAWNMITVCGYLVAEKHLHMAIWMNMEIFFYLY